MPFLPPNQQCQSTEGKKKGKTRLDINETKDDWVLGWQWHQLDNMQTICTSGATLFLTPV